MSREYNNLQRCIEEGLAERREMLDWIRRAQSLSSFVRVTERDWLIHGALSPCEWLYMQGADDASLWLGDNWHNWGDETWDAPELNEWDDWEQHERDGNDWRLLQDDWDDNWEPPDLEFGGQYYPAEHVRDIRDSHEVSRGLP